MAADATDILEQRASVDLPKAIRASRIDDEIAAPPDFDAVDYVPVAQRVHRGANSCAPFASRHWGELANAAAPKFGSLVSADRAELTELEEFLVNEKEKLARAGSGRTWIFMSITVGFFLFLLLIAYLAKISWGMDALLLYFPTVKLLLSTDVQGARGKPSRRVPEIVCPNRRKCGAVSRSAMSIRASRIEMV